MDVQDSNTKLSRPRMEMELDRLTNLPSELIEHILSELPIKEAVRTCVLSSKWRYKPAMLKILVFDEEFVSTLDHWDYVNIVDHVLLLHIGPIDDFELFHKEHVPSSHIDRWILHLSRNSIKEFTLDFFGESHYKVPSSLFSCQDLKHLNLFQCNVKPPITFKGFRSLESIVFHSVSVTQHVFEDLISRSPMLESLTITEWGNYTHFMVDAPNLQFLKFSGQFKEVIFEHTSNLTDVCIDLVNDINLRNYHGRSSKLVQFSACLPQIQSLKIVGLFLEYLSIGTVPSELPKPCLHLKFLYIEIFFYDHKEIPTALCLLTSSPVLQELEVVASKPALNYEGKMASWLDDHQSGQFPNLRRVKIIDISGGIAELELIRFLLLSSPLLQSMTVRPTSANKMSSDILKKLVQFKRASADAEIIYLDP